MFCPRCGTENRSNARFCKTCGYKIEGAVTVQSPAVEPPDSLDLNGSWKSVGSSFLVDPSLTQTLSNGSETSHIDVGTALIPPNGAPGSEAATRSVPTVLFDPMQESVSEEKFAPDATLPAWGGAAVFDPRESATPVIFHDEADATPAFTPPAVAGRPFRDALDDLSAMARTDELMLVFPEESAKGEIVSASAEAAANDAPPPVAPPSPSVAPLTSPVEPQRRGTSPLFAPPPAPPPVLPLSLGAAMETRSFQKMEPEPAPSEPPRLPVTEQNVKVTMNGERGTLPLQSDPLPPEVANAPFRPLTPPAGVPRPFGQRPPEAPPAPKSPGDLFSQPNPKIVSPTGRRSKKLFLILASVAIGLFVVVGAVAAVLSYRHVFSTPPAVDKPVVATQTEPPPVPPPNDPPQSTIPADMAEIPGGDYQVGRDSGDFLDRYEKPKHMVTVQTFYIDKTEVTNLEYKKFMDATGRPAPGSWRNGQIKEGIELFPVTGVSWDDANEYAKWAGKRLPTEEEWEIAARAQTGMVFPWGDVADETRMNIGATGVKSAVKVGSYPAGVSPFGLFDMSGNVWEWTGSEARAYPGSVEKDPKETLKSPLKPDEKLYVIRGGSYLDKKDLCTATYRNWVVNTTRDATLGFRCAKSQ